MSLRILATGGTFDKRYDAVHGQLGFDGSCISQLLGAAQVDAAVESIMAIDSLDMTDADRDLIANTCASSQEHRLVIVHGTDTMVETAATIASRQLDKTIVLTGAMIPEVIRDSDARFNLGFACAAARFLAPGVWIAMHGRAHDWQSVQKNRTIGRFESTA